MPKEKPELSDAMRKKMSGKPPEKNPINRMVSEGGSPLHGPGHDCTTRFTFNAGDD